MPRPQSKEGAAAKMVYIANKMADGHNLFWMSHPWQEDSSTQLMSIPVHRLLLQTKFELGKSCTGELQN